MTIKQKLKAAINRWSFAQMTSNETGKTSASGTMGVLICAVGSFTFLLGCIDKMFVNQDVDILTQTIIFTGIGAGLLGLRKYKSSSDGSTEDTDDTSNGD